MSKSSVVTGIMDTLTRYSQQFVTRFARQFNRGSALGFILTIVLVALAVNLLFDFEPEVRESTAPQTFRGFRSFELTEDLSLPEAALNLKYYLTMSSACHESGANAAQAAYSYLYNATNRYMQNGKWSFKQVRDAIQASRKTYQEIYTALECRADSDNYHGLDLDSDLRLKTLALNLQFYQEKVPVCKKAGNKVDMRAYGHLANMEHRMLYSGRYTVEQIQKAISEAKTSPDRQKIHGC